MYHFYVHQPPVALVLGSITSISEDVGPSIHHKNAPSIHQSWPTILCTPAVVLVFLLAVLLKIRHTIERLWALDVLAVVSSTS